MNKNFSSLAVGLAIAVFTSTAFAAGEDMKKMDMPKAGAMAQAPKAGAMDEAMMAKFKEYSTPNENHRVLDVMIGNWTFTSKHWMSSTSPVEEMTGTSSTKWIMDGRFLEETVQGTSMGQPFNGVSLTGYDNAGKEYQSIWYDNMGTGMMITSGTYDAATKTLTQTGKFNCPLRGNMAVRWVTKIVDENTISVEMWGPDETGKDFLGMEIIYTRAK